MRTESLIDERVLDEAIDQYVAWREECYAVQEAYERWTHSGGGDAAWAFARYQDALDREGQVAAVYRSLMARVVITPEPRRGLFSCMTGEHGVACYALAWILAFGIPAVLTALVLAVAGGTGLM